MKATAQIGMLVTVVVALVASGSCGSSPMSPGPVTPITPPVTAVNTPPVIESIVASASRAEVDTDVTLTATVRDAETPIGQLKFEWKADAGTFSGEGATVSWRAPKGTTTPADYTIRLTVTETYGTANAVGGSQQNIVNGTSPVIRLHDSPKELGALAMSFLGDFANSSVSPSTCVRDFSDGCRGKADEKSDIESNREHFTITNSSLRLQNVRVGANGTTANMSVACSFTSRIIKCQPGSTGCVVGSVGTVAGDCALTGVYRTAALVVVRKPFQRCAGAARVSVLHGQQGGLIPARDAVNKIVVVSVFRRTGRRSFCVRSVRLQPDQDFCVRSVRLQPDQDTSR